MIVVIVVIVALVRTCLKQEQRRTLAYIAVCHMKECAGRLQATDFRGRQTGALLADCAKRVANRAPAWIGAGHSPFAKQVSQNYGYFLGVLMIRSIDDSSILAFMLSPPI